MSLWKSCLIKSHKITTEIKLKEKEKNQKKEIKGEKNIIFHNYVAFTS